MIFAYHGYPWLIHRLTYRRNNHHNLHVRGYKEEGTTTTPFDMVMLNNLDRFHLVMDVIDRVPGLGPAAGCASRWWTPASGPRLDPRARRGPARGRQLDLARHGDRARSGMTGVLVVNAGSSSLKLSVLGPANEAIASLNIDAWDGSPDHSDLGQFLRAQPGLDAAGHRVVHGGSRFIRATVIDEAVIAGIADLTDLAPVHQPRALIVTDTITHGAVTLHMNANQLPQTARMPVISVDPGQFKQDTVDKALKIFMKGEQLYQIGGPKTKAQVQKEYILHQALQMQSAQSNNGTTGTQVEPRAGIGRCGLEKSH